MYRIRQSVIMSAYLSIYICQKGSCEYEPPKRGYLSVLGQNWTETVTIDSGTKVKAFDNPISSLY